MSRPPTFPVVQQVRPAPAVPHPEPAELRDAARCTVVDEDGRRVPFGTLYSRQKAVVVFVREANVRLIVIGQSSYHHIKPFCSLTGYPHEMYVDPQREIYKILGMKRGEGNGISGKNNFLIFM
ncbi:UNVERIFIED_CONTAM: hypothetical protein H355_006935 [Colinus virginianus]|nr:hypothetical protein H355_006935 [Colinus virginianus]